MHVTGKIHQTLPLFYGLETTGVYVHATAFDIPKKYADVTVESEVRNESGERATVGLTAVIVDQNGQVRAHFDGDPVDMVDGEKTVLTAMGGLRDARFWCPEDPYLYNVYAILNVDGNVVDVDKVVTGFRKAEFKGGAGSGGVYLNDRFVYLKGFAQRSSNEWAGLGQAYPDWIHDYNAKLTPRRKKRRSTLDRSDLLIETPFSGNNEATARVERPERIGGLHKRSAEAWGQPTRLEPAPLRGQAHLPQHIGIARIMKQASQ